MKKFFENHQIEETVGTVVTNENNRFTHSYSYTTPEVEYRNERGNVIGRKPSETRTVSKTTFNNKFTIKTLNDDFCRYDVDGYDLTFKTGDSIRILTAIFRKRKIIFAVIDSNKNEIQFNTFRFRRKLKHRLYFYNFILLSVLTALFVLLQNQDDSVRSFIRNFCAGIFFDFYSRLMVNLVYSGFIEFLPIFYLLSMLVITSVVRIMLELYIFRIKWIYTPKGVKEKIVNDCELALKGRIIINPSLFLIWLSFFLFTDDRFDDALFLISSPFIALIFFLFLFSDFDESQGNRMRLY